MKYYDYLLVGGGLAGATCAKTLRDEGVNGSVCIFCAENFPPYNRPPLSKGLLLGYETEDSIWVNSNDYYSNNSIEVRLNTPVRILSAKSNVVIDSKNDQYSFKKLLVATGTKLRKITLPGSDLQNVFYLRALDESRAIKAAMNEAQSAVIIGAGFIGMELASAMAQNGIKTTMLVRENRLFEKMGSEDISSFFERYYRQNGVDIVFETQAKEIFGTERVEKVVLESGAEVAADIVIIGVGVIPEVGFLEGSGVETGNGVVVNKYLESVSRSDVFAAGDVANYQDLVFEKDRRVEHWDHAIKQGKVAAKNMLGNEEPYSQVAYFFSDMFDVSWEFIGDNSDVDEVTVKGEWKEDEATIVYFLKGKVLKAAFLLMAEQEDREKAEQLIISRQLLDHGL